MKARASYSFSLIDRLEPVELVRRGFSAAVLEITEPNRYNCVRVSDIRLQQSLFVEGIPGHATRGTGVVVTNG
jgi:hypothetical protein